MSTTSVQAIDAWAQPMVPNADRNLPEIERLFEQSGTGDLLKTGITTEGIIERMDEAGIDKLMLSAWCRPGQWLITNDAIAEMVQAYPDRFVGVAAVDLADPVKAVRELEFRVKDQGFKALRIMPWLWKLPPNDKLYYPLYVRCVELGIPCCTQVGHTGPLLPSETGRPIPYIDEVALTFPELVIVCGHIGYPWTDEMVAVAWKHANVYIDTSAYLPRYYPPQLMQYLVSYGKRKVLFGTNFPQLRFEKCMEQALELGLPEEVQKLFLRENARRVFNLD